MTMAELPKDLVEEILCRVPATSVKRLRSTCKSWNKLFTNRRFARKHSHKPARQVFNLILTQESRICPTSINLRGPFPSLEVKNELSLFDPHSSKSSQVDTSEARIQCNISYKVDISGVFHCDGLLLCTSHDLPRLVVWNPCTGEIRWITANKKYTTYVLGYYQDSKSYSRRYKILSFKYSTSLGKYTFEIYEFSSDSWRVPNQDIMTGWDFSCGYSKRIVSLKGNAYWFATDKTKTHPSSVYLRRFDFSSEKSSRLVHLPYQSSTFGIVNLSGVGEDKLSVLLQHDRTSKTEVWVTNKIEETKPVSWSKVLALDLNPDIQIWSDGTFLLDEEKKVALYCDFWNDMEHFTREMYKDKIYCLGEDNNVTQVYTVVKDVHESKCLTAILSYVPSLVQIERVRGKKRKRGD